MVYPSFSSFQTGFLNVTISSLYSDGLYKELRPSLRQTKQKTSKVYLTQWPTSAYCLIKCIMCTNLEEVLKCDALIEFIRLLCARKWSCWLYPDTLMLSWDALPYIPCDPLKYWPPPTWLHQQCIWLFPSPVSHSEITAPPPPEQTWTTAEVRYSVML